MKIVIAPNALKGSLSAPEAAEAMAEGVQRVLRDAELVLLPVSDGGDGLLDSFEHFPGNRRITKTVNGPLDLRTKADFIYNKTSRIAVIEMALTSGLALLQHNELDPMNASSYGVGELILAALDHGAVTIILGIGGSASCDGGTGMLSALGIHFLDSDNRLLEGKGINLEKINSFNLDSLDRRLGNITLQVICDVDNALLGESGAAKVFAPQKGATPAQVKILEHGLGNLADKIEVELGLDVRNVIGAGAAGGLGAGVYAFLQAELVAGAEFVLQQCHFDQALNGADLVLTAEGQLDGQSCFGKATSVVARHAMAMNIPCYAIGGSFGPGAEELKSYGINAMFALCKETMEKDDCIHLARPLLADATEQAARHFLTAKAG